MKPFIDWVPEVLASNMRQFEGIEAIRELQKLLPTTNRPAIILHSWDGQEPWTFQGNCLSSCYVKDPKTSEEYFTMGFEEGGHEVQQRFVWPIRLADFQLYFPILGIQIF
jgi:hypothetical protein